MEEKILDFIMEYAQEHENVPFQIIEENFNIQMDESLRSIISDAIWDRDNVSDVVIENEGLRTDHLQSGKEIIRQTEDRNGRPCSVLCC